MSVPSPEALTAEPISRLDYAREQLRNTDLTPAERAVAWSIVSSSVPPTSGVPDGAAFSFYAAFSFEGIE